MTQINDKVFLSDLEDSIKLKQEVLKNKDINKLVIKAAKTIVDAYKNGNKVLIAGNGGSACDAMHMAGELVNYFNYPRPALACEALSSNGPVITAIGNDSDFNFIFSRQLEANGKKGDVFIGITTSGNSKDILEAFKVCKQKGIFSICLNGKNGGMITKENIVDIDIVVPSNSTPRIQEVQLVIEHAICHIVEDAMFGK